MIFIFYIVPCIFGPNIRQLALLLVENLYDNVRDKVKKPFSGGLQAV